MLGEYLTVMIAVYPLVVLHLITPVYVLGGKVNVNGTPDLVDERLGQDVATVVKVDGVPVTIDGRGRGNFQKI